MRKEIIEPETEWEEEEYHEILREARANRKKDLMFMVFLLMALLLGLSIVVFLLKGAVKPENESPGATHTSQHYQHPPKTSLA